MQLGFPYGFDPQGRTAQAVGDAHIRDLIEQLLFTAPGERVNRPTFGTGLSQLLFAPIGPELATATQFLVQGALQQWLGDLVKFTGVQVDSVDSSVTVTVQYVVLATQQRMSAEFTRGGV
jgi:uncharacterized protein